MNNNKPSQKIRNSNPSLEDYVSGVRSGNRIILAQAITLIESKKSSDQEKAQELLIKLSSHSGNSLRIGISGIPGAGKSTLIDNLGCQLIEEGHKLAVLTIDPSSVIRGGSILGDKTRMIKLSRNANAYIRPSPSDGNLGGVTRTTREAIVICEAAGFDIIFIETVGVGQSEVTVSQMVDFFLLLLISGAGDELQGIKKGVLEIADMIAINKADGENINSAKKTASDYSNAIKLIKPIDNNWNTPVLTISSLENHGLRKLWGIIENRLKERRDSGDLHKFRLEQQIEWMWKIAENKLIEKLKSHKTVAKVKNELEESLKNGTTTPGIAARKLLEIFEK